MKKEGKRQMADIRLDEEQLHAVIRAAILAHLGPERREALIAGAVDQLLKTKREAAYPGGPIEERNPLQRAFALAVETVARELALEMVRGDEVLRAKLRELIADALVKVAEKKDLPEKIADNVAAAIEKATRGY